MKKLGWVLCGALLVCVLGLTAAAPDDSAKLDEIKALLQESVRLQKMDLHPRLYPHHKMFGTCDFAAKCKTYDELGQSHEMKRLLAPEYRPTHVMDEGCVDVAACKKREIDWQERGKKADELLQKAQKKYEDK